MAKNNGDGPGSGGGGGRAGTQVAMSGGGRKPVEPRPVSRMSDGVQYRERQNGSERRRKMDEKATHGGKVFVIQEKRGGRGEVARGGIGFLYTGGGDNEVMETKASRTWETLKGAYGKEKKDSLEEWTNKSDERLGLLKKEGDVVQRGARESLGLTKKIKKSSQ